MSRFIRYLAGLFLPIAILAVAACATVKTPEQGFYAAQAQYNIVLSAAVAYAETPTADPSIVHKIRQVNDRVKPALEEGQHFLLCDPSADPVVSLATTAYCSGYKGGSTGLADKLVILSTATQELANLLRQKAATP